MAELIGQYAPRQTDLERQIAEAIQATGMARQEVIDFFGFGKEQELPEAPPVEAPLPPPPTAPPVNVPIPRPFGGGTGSLIGRRREQLERAGESLAERRAREAREKGQR